MHASRFLMPLATLLLLLVGAMAVPLTAAAQADPFCEQFPETGQESCDAFLSFWEHNGGLLVFGMPVTSEFSELSADTLTQHDVQYYERERFEHHPEHAGTPYAMLLGRLGVNMLEANGIDWMTLPKANPSELHYMDATGQAIAPEFWSYWSSHGLDFGDEGISFRESLALFGYPISLPSMETNADGDTVLTQWFERARFELHGDTVLLGRLGSEVNVSDGQFAIRVQLEMDAVMRMVNANFESTGWLASVQIPGVGEWVGNVGVSDDTTGARYSDTTFQRVGSITKTFIGTLILQLVDQGLLSLDDTADQWFEGVPNGDRITVRMLLNMSSGIVNYTDFDDFWLTLYANPEKVWTSEELLAYGFNAPPLFDPGARYYYDNTNTIMLGLILEDITGQDVRTLLQEQILDPLGLTHTSFPANEDTAIPEFHPRGMTRNLFTRELLDATSWNPSWAWAAGQMISTQADLAVWVRALATGELLSPELQAERLVLVDINPGLAGYGLGIMNFVGWLGHQGDLPGYNSEAWYRPDLDATLLVFTNSDIKAESGLGPASAVFNEIAGAILNREYPLPTAEE